MLFRVLIFCYPKKDAYLEVGRPCVLVAHLEPCSQNPVRLGQVLSLPQHRCKSTLVQIGHEEMQG